MKKCNDCLTAKPLCDFRPNPLMRDGHLNACRSCVTAKGRARWRANMAGRPWIPCACGCSELTQTKYRKGHASRLERGMPDGALFDECDRPLAEAFRWYRNGRYIARTECAGGGNRTIYFHCELPLVKPAGHDIDHINGNGFDNRRCNLRVISHAENGQNRTKLDTRNKTGYRNVVYRPDFGKFVAYGAKNRKYVHLGSYETAEEAAAVAARFRLENYPGAIERATPV